ncbi:MAG: hypothetical protein AABY95_06660 [Pseudomonadota bacterium]
MRICLTALALFTPGLAYAHSFGRLYNLPVPFWLYAYGATAALVLSFLIVGFFVTAKSTAALEQSRDLSDARWLQALRRLHAVTVFKLLSVSLLLLCVLTGFFGNPNPYVNFNMTFFWIVFVLGFAYLTALIGDLYAAINPWRVIAETLGRFFRSYTQGRWAYPARLSYWPALLFYMAFIWIELFGFTRPLSLSAYLAAYSIVNLFGVWLIGTTAWFRYCEFFSVFLRLTALMAPLDYSKGKLRLRWPFAGALEHRAESLSLLLFVLFMLSSTAYDGLRATVPWVRIFWNDPFNLLTPLMGKSPIYAYVELRPFYLIYESLWLLMSPFIYLGVYLCFIALVKRAGDSPLSVRELALRFGYSLLPIALVYNITHYNTLILTQGVKIISLLSDPFGWGWNVFGTAGQFRAPFLPDMAWVWHSQVGLILFGHIVSVVLAHHEALRQFPTRRQATLSQLPMLFLMMIFTTAGLWILSQPIQSGM